MRRRRVGTKVKTDEYNKMIADDDEVEMLESRDVDEMAEHRMDRMGAVGRHKISRHSDQNVIRVKRLDILVRCVI